tara:strand:+ start:5199 stop:5708 length:510 start_codon:yes stop_codon:yes gene_type:complete
MAQALFVTRKDLVKFTSVSGGVDTDKFIQYVKIAQDIHIQNFLGTDLYNKISADIVASPSTLTGDYLTLVEDHVKPMLIHWAMVEFLPFSAYTIANKGVYKNTSENSESVTKEEVDFLIQKERITAQYYTDRFISYMSFNASTKFPEYYSNNNDDIYPDKDANFAGWVL